MYSLNNYIRKVTGARGLPMKATSEYKFIRLYVYKFLGQKPTFPDIFM